MAEELQATQAAQPTLAEQVQQQSVQIPEVAKPVSKFGQQKEVEIKRADGGVDKYLLQYPGIRKAMEIIDNSTMPNGQLARSIFADQLLEHVVVQPANLSLDDFDEREGINQLIDAADEFLGELWK
ncbi:hypothetical protein [Weissella thailandensis]|uniref:Phage protein n=1 Tax=Weissella thailandensis TaxID=89061 RepID=A0ABX9I693_9LACO|nr:hypothetical protein [Weissella thailandensis]NKY90153.1 hypothetical protein [Weissella thailandensis]RDS60231.1 hypothetical protein DWV05_01400 [Weissella thailandensis]GEP74112.1 hypothetical protein WTH01_03590 [Weissella thailandensis]